MSAPYKLVDLDSGETHTTRPLPAPEIAPKDAYTKRDIEVCLMTLRDLESMQRLLRVLYVSRNSDLYMRCVVDRSFTRDLSSYAHVVGTGVTAVRHSQTMYFADHNPRNACIANTIEDKEMRVLNERLPGLNEGVVLLTKLDIDIELPGGIILHDTKNTPTEKTPINFVVTFSTKERPGEIRKCVLSVKLQGIFIRNSDISFDYDDDRHTVRANFICGSAAIIAPQSHMVIESVEYTTSDHIYQPFSCRASVEYMRLPCDMEETLKFALQKKLDLTVIGDMCYVEKMTGKCTAEIYTMTNANRVYINTNIARAIAGRNVLTIQYINQVDMHELFGPQDEDEEEEEINDFAPIVSSEEAFVLQHKGISFDAEFCFETGIAVINVAHKQYFDEWTRLVRGASRSNADRPTAFRYEFCYD